MASANETVRECIAAYPTLFKTRTDALHHVLCVLGGGYEWRNGEVVPIDAPHNHAAPWTVEEHERRMMAQFGHLPERALESVRWVYAETQAECLAILATLDDRVHDWAPLDREVYPQSDHVPLMTVPADVTPDWAAACEQMRDLVRERGWVFPAAPAKV